MIRHKETLVCFKVMHLNGIAFSVSMSRELKFYAAEALENRKSETLLTSMGTIKMTYGRWRFLASQAAANNEFSSPDVHLANISIALNTIDRDKQVPEVEKNILTLQDTHRSTYNM